MRRGRYDPAVRGRLGWGGRAIARALAATFVIGGTATAVLVGVTESGGGASGRHVAIIAPADGAEVALGQTVAVTAQGFDPNGVIAWEVIADGDRIAGDELGDDGPTHVPIEARWRPEEAGTFRIEVRVTGVGDRPRPAGAVSVQVVDRDDLGTTSTSTSTTTTPRGDGGSTTTSSAPSTIATPTTSATTATTGATSTTVTTAPTTSSTTSTTQATTTTEADVTPPVVDVSHSPVRPDERTAVTYTATATDDRRVARVEIWVRINNNPKTDRQVALCLGSPCVARDTQRYFAGDEVDYWAVAVDDAGNTASSVVRTFTVTQVAPV